MSFKYKEIEVSVLLDSGNMKSVTDFSYVWSRQSGDCVIVVIDDEWDCCMLSLEALEPINHIFPRLKEAACTLPDIRAIGFFPLAGDKKDVYRVLECIEKWLSEIKTPETRIYFLVDVFSAMKNDNACISTKEWLNNKGYPPEQIRHLTRAGGITDTLVLDRKRDFVKIDEADDIRDHNGFSLKLKEFLGIKLHEDEIISEAIKFYTKAWEASWTVKGWDHYELETLGSVHLEALADWLGDSINVGDLYDWESGQSAKSLMIWVPTEDNDSLWGDHRPIQGKVLKAAMEKLRIPLSEDSPIPEKAIDMPCTPCLPFLISLRSFLLCCKNHEKPVPVKEVQFRRDDKHCSFHLILEDPLDNPGNLKEMYRDIKAKDHENPPGEHPLAKSLIELTYCITNGLPKNMGRGYIRLFTEGAKINKDSDASVVEVGEITKDCIELIWYVD